MEAVYRSLAGEPWCKSPWEIAELTLASIQKLYAEQAKKMPKGPVSYKDQCYYAWQFQGFSLEECHEKWKVKQATPRRRRRGKKHGR